MSARYRDHGQTIHKYYKSLTHLSWDNRLKQMPNNLCEISTDWEYLCRLFESDEFKVKVFEFVLAKMVAK